MQVGDQILSVDGCPVSSASEALRLLSCGGEGVQLKVGTHKGCSSTLSSNMSTLRSQKLSKSESTSSVGAASGHTLSRRDAQVSHCESVAVTLHAAPGGYGITLDGCWPPVIADIEPGSPADLLVFHFITIYIIQKMTKMHRNT